MQRNSVIFLRNLERFRLITFDITDTLLRFRLQPGQLYAETAYKFGEKIDPDALKSCFKKQFKVMSEKYPNFGRNSALDWREWWVELVEKTFECTNQYKGDREKLKLIAETLVKVYRTRESWLHVDGCHEIVEKCKKDAGKRLGCISNFDPSLETVLSEMSIAHYFDFIITSYEVKPKPHKEIFNAALEKLPCEVSGKEALHIGNTYELDYVGARNAGWSSLLIAQSLGTHHEIQEGHVYKTLRDLLTALQTKDLRDII